MVLSKDGIKYCCENMHLIDDYCPENIQACSYDLRMGGQYYYYKKGDHGVNVRSLPKDGLLEIPPNAICYVITEESVNMPENLTASISLSFGLIRAILKISNNQHSETRQHNRYWRHNRQQPE